MVVLVESGGGYAEVSVGTGSKLGETRLKWVQGEWSCCCQGPDVWASCRMSGTPDARWTRGGCPGSWNGDEHDELHGKNCYSGAKFRQIGGWKSRERWWKSRSTRCKADPWIKSNKTSSHQQITKKIFWAIFGGEFSDLGRKQQNQARKRGVGAPKT